LALARAVVIVPSGARVLRDRDNYACVTAPPCIGGNEAHSVSAGSLLVETTESVQEEPEAEHHLHVEKARNSLRSYSTEVLGPHVASLCVGAPTRLSRDLARFRIPR
jgi:hypothetical protein